MKVEQHGEAITSFELDARPGPRGVDIELALTAEPNGHRTGALVHLDRGEARSFAHAILAAAGDGIERTMSADMLSKPKPTAST